MMDADETKIYCSMCWTPITENAVKCEESSLFLHEQCSPDVDVCVYCDKREIEKLRNVSREKMHEALDWIIWHCEEAVLVQMRLIRELHQLIDRFQFTTAEDFLHYIKRRMTEIFSKGELNEPSIQGYLKLHETAVSEVNDFQRCYDCFQSRHTLPKTIWFTNVCTNPHLLVFAKYANHPFWPAKVLMKRVNSGELFISFFGDHKECWIDAEKCYLLSTKYPMNSEPKDDCYLEAKAELEKHVRKLRCAHPLKFRFAPRKQKVNPNIIHLFDEPLFCKDSGAGK